MKLMVMRVQFDAEETSIPDLKAAVVGVDAKAEITFHNSREAAKPKEKK